MIAVIQKYRAILIVLFFLALAVILSWFVLKPDVDEIPSRGIFVSV